MPSKLKPCPFCETTIKRDTPGLIIPCDCIIEMAIPSTLWNNRPIEDKLFNRIKKMADTEVRIEKRNQELLTEIDKLTKELEQVRQENETLERRFKVNLFSQKQYLLAFNMTCPNGEAPRILQEVKERLLKNESRHKRESEENDV